MDFEKAEQGTVLPRVAGDQSPVGLASRYDDNDVSTHTLATEESEGTVHQVTVFDTAEGLLDALENPNAPGAESIWYERKSESWNDPRDYPPVVKDVTIVFDGVAAIMIQGDEVEACLSPEITQEDLVRALLARLGVSFHWT
ncbi:hypothetical protein GF373_17780 [bacterium]|nr:hypothetical protein [bacterium]